LSSSKAFKEGAPQNKIDRCCDDVMPWEVVSTYLMINLTLTAFTMTEYPLTMTEDEKEAVEREAMGEDEEEEEPEDEDHRWEDDWFKGMKPYNEQLQTWRELQDYDPQEERDMATRSDYKLGIYDTN